MEALDESINTKTQENLEGEIEELQLSLPKETWLAWPMYLYQGFWCFNTVFEGIIAFKTHFQAHDTDIILASYPKTGSTWLKSLIFAIINRNKMSNDFTKQLFHTKNPHELVQQLEINVYKKVHEKQPELSKIPSPRLFATHLPYNSLPDSIHNSKCRIIYICRNPLDTFVSYWHFHQQFDACNGIKPNMEMMEKYVTMFCSGVSPWGPYEDHVLDYWKESKQNIREKMFFIEYEGLKKEPRDHLKRLAEFMGCPFSEEEEKQNVIEEIIELCSFKSLKNMDVNKNGKVVPRFENKAFFRKGEVGDWTNYLTPTMVRQFDQMLERLKMDGFSFSYYHKNS